MPTSSTPAAPIANRLPSPAASRPYADRRSVTPEELAAHRIWIPGIRPGSERAAFHEALAAEFGLRIDRIGPDSGTAP